MKTKTSTTRKLVVAGTLAAAIFALATGPARARITSPADGAVVNGPVTIAEDRGGVVDSLCALFGLSADSTITVTRQADNVVVLNRSKGSPGAWSTVWDTTTTADGAYTIKSVAKDRRTSNFCLSAITTTLSTLTVTVQNFIPFTDDGGLGVVRINPYTKQFRVTAGAFDSGVVSDPDMQLVEIPSAPSAPGAPGAPGGVAAWCTDPTSPAFAPRLLVEGPQGCLDPNPLNPPPSIPPSVPGPPNPPGSACEVSGCNDRAIVIAYHGEAFALTGVFEVAERVFGAVVATTDGGTVAPMRHTPAPPA